jgi:hypothetical protein
LIDVIGRIFIFTGVISAGKSEFYKRRWLSDLGCPRRAWELAEQE